MRKEGTSDGRRINGAVRVEGEGGGQDEVSKENGETTTDNGKKPSEVITCHIHRTYDDCILSFSSHIPKAT